MHKMKLLDFLIFSQNNFLISNLPILPPVKAFSGRSNSATDPFTILSIRAETHWDFGWRRHGLYHIMRSENIAGKVT